MARDVIDQLSLNIDINVDKQIDVTINNLADAIKNLNAAVADVSNLNAYVQALKQLSNAATRSPRKTAMGNIVGGKGTPQLKTEEVNVETQNEEQLKSVEKSNEVRKETIEQTKDLSERTRELGNNAKKSSGFWSKFMKSLGRIALYRVVRSVLKSISSGLLEGIQNVRSVNTELDKTLKNLSQSSTSLKNSFATAITPLINAITPLITKVADTIAIIINRIEEAKAVLSGADSYTKILTSDTKEWQEQLKKATGYLLSFDKFESLNKENSYTGVVKSPISMDKKQAQSILMQLELLKAALEGIAVVLSTIVALNIISFLTNIGTMLTPLIVGFQTFRLQCALANTTLQRFQLSLGLIIAAILTLTIGIVSLVSAWGDMGTWQKVITIFVSLTAAIGAAVVALKLFKGNWFAALSVAGIVAGAGLTIGSQLSKLSVNKFADGGEFTKGQVFIAGEAGAEMVYNTQSGNGGVANIDQIREAEYLGTYQALLDYGAARGDLSSLNGMTVVLDGKKVGQLVAGDVIREGRRVGYLSATR